MRNQDVAKLSHMPLSVATARRGWVTPGDVLNTRAVEELRRSCAERAVGLRGKVVHDVKMRLGP